MIFEKKLLQIILSPHISEKSSISMKKNNVIVLKVLKNSTKYDIKTAIRMLFKVDVKKVNTLIVKGKKKRQKNNIFKKSDWKKAYISLKSGQNLDFISNSNIS